MRAYKIELLVLDFDKVGDEVSAIIENARYPNRCIAPQVMGVQFTEIGEWSDDHPLNRRETAVKEYYRLFYPELFKKDQ